jgi:hypothetical protein
VRRVDSGDPPEGVVDLSRHCLSGPFHFVAQPSVPTAEFRGARQLAHEPELHIEMAAFSRHD